MKYSYKWLKELSGTKLSVEKLTDLLTLHAFEIEGVEKFEGELDGVVVGEVLEVNKHPDADKLKLVRVDIDREVLDIVCGAPNISKGQKVPVATVGTILPNGLEIKEAEIRGQKSVGMVCAEDELGLGDSHEGIMVLGVECKKGASVSSVLDLDDAVIDIDVLANRGHDALSHVGMAREVSALEGGKLDYDYEGLKILKTGNGSLNVLINDQEKCSRYIGAVLENIEVKDSPQWMKNRLKKSGIKPINNIVDTTNYVMLEIGQPMHAFDAEKINGGIRVRNAKEKEKISLLDNSEKELSKNDLVIADNEKAIALAGIMGGMDSSVTQNTKKIILESANFNYASIRRTRMRLGVMTDSALRFEKGIDPNISEKAIVRAIEILKKVSNAEMVGIVDLYPKKLSKWKIELNLEYVNNLLGEKVSPSISKSILKSLGLGVKGLGSKLTVEIPTFRLDLGNQEDLIEEIGRIYGYDKIKSVPSYSQVKTPRENNEEIFVRELKDSFMGQGFSEVYNYSFYGANEMEMARLENIDHLELENPISTKLSTLRASLVPGMLSSVAYNLKNFDDISIFEIGNVFSKGKKGEKNEKMMTIGAIVSAQSFEKNSSKDKRDQSCFYEAKSHLNRIIGKLGLGKLEYSPSEGGDLSFWHPGRVADLVMGKENMIAGKLGEIDPTVLSDFGIDKRVAVFEIDIERIISMHDSKEGYSPMGKYPSVIRDISILSDAGDRDFKAGKLMQAIEKAGKGVVRRVELFDAISYSEKEDGLAFHITFSSDERTLENEEVDKLMKSIVSTIEDDFPVKVRR